MWSEFAKIKGAEITLHAKSSTFTAAKLKCFTVVSLVVVGSGKAVVFQKYISAVSSVKCQPVITVDRPTAVVRRVDLV